MLSSTEAFQLIGTPKQLLGTDAVQCIALCSSMDLIAIALQNTEQVSVLRLDLQKIWTRVIPRIVAATRTTANFVNSSSCTTPIRATSINNKRDHQKNNISNKNCSSSTEEHSKIQCLCWRQGGIPIYM